MFISQPSIDSQSSIADSQSSIDSQSFNQYSISDSSEEVITDDDVSSYNYNYNVAVMIFSVYNVFMISSLSRMHPIM